MTSPSAQTDGFVVGHTAIVSSFERELPLEKPSTLGRLFNPMFLLAILVLGALAAFEIYVMAYS